MYDAWNRLKTAQSQAAAGADCWGLSFGYDVWANLASAGVTKCAAPTLSLTINAQNRIADAGYGYDLAGNLTAEPGRSYTYNAENRMTGMNSGAATYTYDVDGSRARKQVGADWTESFDIGGNLLFERNAAGEWIDYIYLNGKRIARAATFEDRIRIWGSHCSGCGTQWSRFSFPNAAGLAGYVIQSGDRLFFRQYQGVGRGGMELTFTDATSTTGLVNDQDGIPINADTSTGVWKYRRVDLSSFAGKTVSDVALWVDSVTVGSWEIYYNLISLVSADGTVWPIYDRQKTVSLTVAGPAGSSRNYQVNHWSGGALYTAADNYYHGDHLGSARLMTSHGGYPLWQATYLPYGQELSPQATINRFKFTSKERDGETGLDYFGARYLASTLGRFTTPDEFTGGPVDVFGPTANPPDALPYADITNPQSLNKYAYTYNNPLRYTDPDGHCPDCLWDIASLLSGITSYVSNVKQGNVGDAIVDALGIVGDTAALAVPGVPGGAGVAIKAARAAKALERAKQLEKAVELGKQGEKAAEIVKNTRRIDSLTETARFRVPDEITQAGIREVKNVKELSLTNQIRDLVLAAKKAKQPLTIVVRKNTKLTKPLQKLVDNGQIKLEYLP